MLADLSDGILRLPSLGSELLLHETLYLASERFERLIEFRQIAATAIAMKPYSFDHVVCTRMMREHLIVARGAEWDWMLQLST